MGPVDGPTVWSVPGVKEYSFGFRIDDTYVETSTDEVTWLNGRPFPQGQEDFVVEFGLKRGNAMAQEAREMLVKELMQPAVDIAAFYGVP